MQPKEIDAAGKNLTSFLVFTEEKLTLAVE